ncbi:hypothetical protein, partial [Pseudomonas sp.]|uniref:hypothetical protein n=1 Tax=Pseudomonas sp. TaxID=306 RepID=UPI003FD7C2B2
SIAARVSLRPKPSAPPFVPLDLITSELIRCGVIHCTRKTIHGHLQAFFQFMSMAEDFLPDVRRDKAYFEHESLPIRRFQARCAPTPRNPAIVFKMPPAQ